MQATISPNLISPSPPLTTLRACVELRLDSTEQAPGLSPTPYVVAGVQAQVPTCCTRFSPSLYRERVGLSGTATVLLFLLLRAAFASATADGYSELPDPVSTPYSPAGVCCEPHDILHWQLGYMIVQDHHHISDPEYFLENQEIGSIGSCGDEAPHTLGGSTRCSSTYPACIP